MRWFKQTKKAIQNKSKVLKCMQGLADAETEDKFDTRLQNLCRSNLLASIGSYLETHWLPIKEVYVYMAVENNVS